jgi:hypothetical protein
MGIWKFNTLNQSLATFQTWLLPFEGLCCTHGIIIRGLLRHFISLISCFLKVKTKIDAILCSLRATNSQGHNNCRVHSTHTKTHARTHKHTHTQLKSQLHKMPCSLMVTFTTLIHNNQLNVTKQYIAVFYLVTVPVTSLDVSGSHLILQLILNLYSPHLKQMLKMLNFVSKTCVMSNKHTAHCTPKFICSVSWQKITNNCQMKECPSITLLKDTKKLSKYKSSEISYRTFVSLLQSVRHKIIKTIQTYKKHQPIYPLQWESSIAS